MTPAQTRYIAIRLALLNIDISLTMALAGMRMPPATQVTTSTASPVETNCSASTDEKREEV